VDLVPPIRHLLRAKELADARYFDDLAVEDLARAARLSPAHFSREFRRVFGETPYAYLQTRRLERAAAFLRETDRPVAEVCSAVGLRSASSFTRSFKRAFGLSPSTYRATFAPRAETALVPGCVIRLRSRPKLSTIGQAEVARGD
jgi:AraC-like DNA-binding protein